MSNGISCSILGEGDCPEAVDLLTRVFCEGDPVEAALDITEGEFRVMVELELEPIWRHGLSLVARHAASGRLVGAAIATDALADWVDGRGRISDKFAPIAEIARDFHHAYLGRRAVQPGSCLYLFMVGVHCEMSGRGLGRRLICETLQNARSRGYGSAFALATNLASMHAFGRCGFETLELLEYRTYRYRERAVLASITEHPGIALMERRSLDGD